MKKPTEQEKKKQPKKKPLSPKTPPVEDKPVQQALTTGDAPNKGRLPVRITKSVLKTLFVRIPVALAVIVLVALIAAKAYLSPERVQKLAVSSFNSMSYGELDLKVTEFDPFYGFVIENIVIKNGEEFEKTVFFEMEKLAVKYNFFRMFSASVRIPEVGIYKPRIYLEEKNGVWNAARLMKPAEAAPVKPEEPEEEKTEAAGPPSTEINLPINADFFFHFILDDMRLYARSSSFDAKMEGLTFTADIDVPPFKRVPLSVEAVNILRKMNISLNPAETIDISFVSPDAELKRPLVLNWKLEFDGGEGEKKFNSRFAFGTYDTPVRFKRTHLAPLSFMVGYDMFYNPAEDHLRLNNLGISFKGKKWLNLAGDVRNVTGKISVDVNMTESSISLNELYPYYVSVTGDRSMFFGGLISLHPFSVKGGLDDLNVRGTLSMKGIRFSMPGTSASIPWFALNYAAAMRGPDMALDAALSIPGLSYALEGEKSGSNGVHLALGVKGFNNFSRVILDKFRFRFYNPQTGSDALSFNLGADVSLAPAMAGSVDLTGFRFVKGPLLPMLPAGIRESLAGLPLSKPVSAAMNVRFGLSDAKQAAKVRFSAGVPDFEINDLLLQVDAENYPLRQRAVINSFNLSSKERHLDVSASGRVDLKTAPLSDSDLKVSVSLDSPKPNMLGPVQQSGALRLSASMKGDLKTGKASGSLYFKDFDIKYPELKFSLEKLCMDFPFSYSFAPAGSGESLLAVKKDQIIDSDRFRKTPNFTIKSIKAIHPARDIQFEYLKDFQAYMAFGNELFQILDMRAYVLDGSLYAKNILFDLGGLDTSRMEYKLILDITNVDINKLDEPDPAKKTRAAELSMNANFSGRGLNVEKELTTSGYINIHKVGKEFADRLMKGLSEEKGKSKLGIAQYAVENSVVKGFNFNLNKGLMYVTVDFDKMFLNNLVRVKDNRVIYDRVPIQEFVRNIMQSEGK